MNAHVLKAYSNELHNISNVYHNYEGVLSWIEDLLLDTSVLERKQAIFIDTVRDEYPIYYPFILRGFENGFYIWEFLLNPERSC